MNKLISVIIPVYNVHSYLRRCLDSVVNQTYKNIEILLVDDGSTDNSAQICLEYEKKYKNVIYLYKKNGGLSDARNYGIKHSKGDYIAFVDSDDYIDPEMYQYLLSDMIKYNADIATCSYQEFSNEFVFENSFSDCKVEVYDRKEGVRNLFRADKYCNYAWNKLYKRELFTDITYPTGKKMEDLGTTYLLFLNSKKITYRHYKAYFYYQRKDSIIHSADNQFYYDKLLLCLERFRSIQKIYPDMEENYVFILRTILLDFKYYSSDLKLFQDAHYVVKKEIPFFALKKISKKQRIKYYILKYLPGIYVNIFGER